MAHKRPAKRANRPNPRADRNLDPITFDPTMFEAAGLEPDATRSRRPRRGLPFAETAATAPQEKVRRVELLPRSLAQESYVDALTDPAKHIVFAMGPAGCGKTLLATQYAIQQLQDGAIRKIVITRPAVSVDEQHGFLPGDLIAKMSPWMLPILDVFKEVYSVPALNRMLLNETIEIAPLAYMRGRTFKNALLIFDEAQNSTVSQTKMVLTRIGEGSRIIVTGDLRQHDRGYEVNGLGDFVQRVKTVGSEGIAVVEFAAEDVERHPIIEDVLRLYQD